jgi:hypothetical protein
MSSPSFNDPLVMWLAAAWLAVLFAHAAVAKLVDRPLFEQHIAAYHVPFALLPLAVWAVPLAELAAAALLLSPWRSLGALLAAGLLLTYAGAMAVHKLQGRALDCGCGGEPLPVSWALVGRNVALALLAPMAAGSGAIAEARALGLGDFAVVAASLPVAALLYAAFNQLLRHQVGERMRRI